MTAEQDDFENARALAATGRILSGLAKLVKNHLNDALKLALLCGWKMIDFGSHRWHLQSGIIAWQGLRRRAAAALPSKGDRSEEHTSALQSLMRSSSAVFCVIIK